MNKNIIGTALLLLPGLFACTASKGQNIDGAKVPEAVKKTFTAKFPKAEGAKWEMEDAKDYEANFTEGGTERSATFDPKGTWLETETGIKASELPAGVTKAIAANYSDQKMKEAEKVETSDRGTLYEVEFTNGEAVQEVQFNADGKVLGSKKETEKDEDKD